MSTKKDDVAELAKGDRQSLAAEFWDFLKHNKKWWLLPILIVVLALGALVFLSGSGAAPARGRVRRPGDADSRANPFVGRQKPLLSNTLESARGFAPTFETS